MKKILGFMTILAIILCLQSEKTVVKAEGEVAKVTFEQNKKKTEQGIVKAKDEAGKTIWIYKTKKLTASDLDETAMYENDDRVYVVEGSKLVALDRATGKTCWTNKKTLSGSVKAAFDKEGNIYLTNFHSAEVIKLSNKGKLIWKSDAVRNKGYSRGIDIKFKKSVIYVTCAIDKKAIEGKYDIKLDSETGDLYKKKNSGAVKEKKETKAYKKYLKKNAKSIVKKMKFPKSVNELQYAFVDIDKNGVLEMVVHAWDADFSLNYIFTYKNGKVVRVNDGNVYTYTTLYYSKKYKSVVFYSIRPDEFGNDVLFCKLKGTNLCANFWINRVNIKKKSIYSRNNANRTSESLTKAKYLAYMNGLSELDWKEMQ